MSNSIGKSFPRKEGRKKVTGQALYVDDLSFPDMLHGATVRSQSPRGKIKNIAFERRHSVGRVHRRHRERHSGRELCRADSQRPALSRRRFREPRRGAGAAASRIATSISSRKRAATFASRSKSSRRCFTLAESLAKKEIIWGDDNVFKKFLVDKGNVDDAWSTADFIVEGEYETGAQEQLYIENNGAIADCECRRRRDGVGLDAMSLLRSQSAREVV